MKSSTLGPAAVTPANSPASPTTIESLKASSSTDGTPDLAGHGSKVQASATLASETLPAPTGSLWSSRQLAVLFSHAVIDFFSMILVPLLSVLEGRVHLEPEQGAILVATGSLTSGLIQPLVALHGDKHDTRWLGTLGFVFGVVCLGCIGFATTFWQLMILAALGAAGVGAFHPPGAAVCGHLAGARRSTALAIFLTAGMTGGISGAALIPQYVKTMDTQGLRLDGVQALALFIPIGLLTAALLAWATSGIAHRHKHAAKEHAELSASERHARWTAIGVLYVGNAMRFIVNMAMVQLLVRWSEHFELARHGAASLNEPLRQAASVTNGHLQSGMAIGMGAGGLVIGLITPRQYQRHLLVLVPVLGAIAVALFPQTGSKPVAFGIAILIGLGYFGVMPTTISMAQRLLPHRTTLASSLMMGGAWSLAAFGPPLAEWLIKHMGLTGTGLVLAGVLLASGLVSLLMPKTSAV